MAERLCNKRQLFKFVDQSDASQELFVKVWRAMRLYDPERGRLYSFLCNVLNNRITGLQILSARDSSRWHYASINDDNENADGMHEGQGLRALNKRSIELWKNNENRANSAPEVEDDDEQIPDIEKDAIKWLLEVIAVDSAADASGFITRALYRNSG